MTRIVNNYASAGDIGEDQVSVEAAPNLIPRAGVDGKLDPDWIMAGTPAAHGSSHEEGGSDELVLAAIPGTITAAQHASLPTGDPHAQYATDADLTSHLGAADPHPAYQRESEKGLALGYAELDEEGLVPADQIAATDYGDLLNVPATFPPIIGGGAGDAVAGNDARLTDARTPTAHTHPASEISDSTVAGQAVLTAATAAAQRTAVGLGSVDNTADSAKPVSTAQQAALDLKAPLASPAFTGTPTGITKTHVGLGSVDNTTDAGKPVSTATQTVLDGKSATGHNHDGSYSALGHTHTGVYEPAYANIQTHVGSAHAPSNAQKNSDITLAEIEAKLVGEISTQTHAGVAVKLDDALAPDDNTDLNASVSAHGLLLKLTGSTTVFLRADGTWSTPTASIAAPFVGDQAPGSFTVATEKFGLQGKRLTLTGAQRGTLEGTSRLLILG